MPQQGDTSRLRVDFIEKPTHSSDMLLGIAWLTIGALEVGKMVLKELRYRQLFNGIKEDGRGVISGLGGSF